MTNLLPFLIAGLTTGSIYGLAAVGLVLTYKTSGVLNFGHGALASASAFLFYFLYSQHRVPWEVAAMVCIFGFGPIVGIVLERVARPLAGAGATTSVLGTVGLLLVIQAALNILFKPGQNRQVHQFLPTSTFRLGGIDVGSYQVIIFAGGVGIAALLTAYLRFSRSGLAMRAVVESPQLLGLTGTSPQRVRRLAWVIGTMLASASGVILAPLLPLDSTNLTFLVVTAFGAAAIGAFANLPLTYLGGLAIGVGQALLQKHFVSSTGLAGGLSSSLPFLILFAMLVAAPRLRSQMTTAFGARPDRRRALPQASREFVGLVLLFGALAGVPFFAGVHLLDWTRGIAFIVVFLSLGLLVRLSGQVSLAQVTFMAIGVAIFSRFASVDHWPWGIALIAAGLATAPIGAVLAIPAIRFPGVYLALASLGFAIVVQQMFYTQSYMFGSLSLGISVRRPDVRWLATQSDRGYYYLALAIAALVAAAVIALEHGRLGRILAAMSNSPGGLAACGASINLSRVLVFSLAASLAAIGGILDAGSVGLVGSDQYQPLTSIQLFVVVLIALGPTPWYAAVAAAAQVVIPSYLSASVTTQYVFSLVFGLSAVLVAMMLGAGYRLPAWEAIRWPRLRLKRRHEVAGRDELVQSVEVLDRLHPRAQKSLCIDAITVHFGGLVAAEQVDLSVPVGQITGLIGPNGAGKSTILNACVGAVRTSSGSVRLGGRDLRRLGPPARSRSGLGRTFQQMELFDSLTVRENVALGAEAAYAGRNPLSHLFSTPGQTRSVSRRTAAALTMCGITDLTDAAVGTLSTGHRRLVELARCAAGTYDILLLDEPSSGLNRAETARFGLILNELVELSGVGILLIEHDMTLINELCDSVHVVDFGHKIFEGTAAGLAESAEVRRAYLGNGMADASAALPTR